MAITRSSHHKRRATGGRRHPHQKKKKYASGRPAAMTKLGPKRIHLVRARGGSLKFRALRLETGNFSWGGEAITKKTRILDVVYNASNNELVRTKTLVKSAVVIVDATPFKAWYEAHYKIALGKKGETFEEAKTAAAEEAKKGSRAVQAKFTSRQKAAAVDPAVVEQFATGRLMAVVASRPGQSGRADGYILEGQELDFYKKKLAAHKKAVKKA